MNRFRSIYRRITGAAILLPVLGLLWQLLRVAPDFSREAVSAALKPVLLLTLPAVLLCLAAPALGISGGETILPVKPGPMPEEKSPKKSVRLILFALAAAFLALGVLNGGMRDVLAKAINICTECIGLG